MKPNPIKPYLEVLGGIEEAILKDGLPSMGSSAETPKLFRCSGKVRSLTVCHSAEPHQINLEAVAFVAPRIWWLGRDCILFDNL